MLVSNFLTDKWYENASLKYSILLGVCIGLATITRPLDVLVFLIPLFWNKQFVELNSTKWTYLKTNFRQIILIAFFVFLISIPQILYWKYTTNHWFYYSYSAEDYFEFKRFRVFHGLFSYRKGWILYSPLVLLGFIGIFLIKKNNKLNFYKLPFLLFFTIFIYLVFSWHNWFYGWGFGCRALVQTIAFLAFPICYLTELFLLKKWIAKISYLIIVFTFIAYNLFQTWQYNKGMIHGTSMNRKSYWSIFLQTEYKSEYDKYLKEQDDYDWKNNW